MQVMNWADSSEIKELHCGEKPVVTQCSTMGCIVVFIILEAE